MATEFFSYKCLTMKRTHKNAACVTLVACLLHKKQVPLVPIQMRFGLLCLSAALYWFNTSGSWLWQVSLLHRAEGLPKLYCLNCKKTKSSMKCTEIYYYYPLLPLLFLLKIGCRKNKTVTEQNFKRSTVLVSKHLLIFCFILYINYLFGYLQHPWGWDTQAPILQIRK